MDTIKEDLKAIRADVSAIKTDVAVNTKSLDHHIARTEIAERRLEKLEYVLIGLLASAVLTAVTKMLI